ncbi:polyhydroxyalkanoate synthesis repressor PhaR [Planktotalea sp.]|uniref:polyhydroxyalkanoate synthesis repressor PhaR n=1 Tax=Planktotalea sp. TaxID=2029877 RepID=UPI0025E20C7B|nr:polyhydroxyalkanoate synthesis repressor PhaR [Planktotalea sp.]
MTDEIKPLLIKRYASRRLYNTETSDYVTLEDISGFISDGRDVQIIDLKSGDDLTRQYLLQIVAERESKGESVLPVAVLTDLVRSYTSQASSVVPQFLSMSFDMLRDSQSKVIDTVTKASPIAQIPGMEAFRTQQEAFFKAMTGGNWTPPGTPSAAPAQEDAPVTATESSEDLDAIKSQLADLQEKLSKLGK